MFFIFSFRLFKHEVINYLSIRVFFHRHWRFTVCLLFHSITSIRSRTLRHLFATLYVRWLSNIFNCNACVYQTATRWDLRPYQITISLTDWLMMQYLLVWFYILRLILRFYILQRFYMGNRWIWTRIDYHSCTALWIWEKDRQQKNAVVYEKFWQQNINYDDKNMPSCIRLTTAKLDWLIGKTSVRIVP